MSRIGKKPINVPANVKINIINDIIEVKGPNGINTVKIPKGLVCELKDNQIKLIRENDKIISNAMYGTVRAHLANAVKGVCDGFYKELEIVGVGYRCQLQGNKMIFNIGYSSPCEVQIPDGIKIIFDEKNKNKFKVWGIDKHKVGQVAAIIRALKEPDPYKGKGIKYTNEVIKLKPGKIAGAK